MNIGGTLSTALLRGFYVALVAGLGAGLAAYQNDSTDEKGALIAGAVAFVAALAWRGGLEGVLDRGRQLDGEIKPSDVQPIGQGEA